MSWQVYISLKSGKYISIEDLEYITEVNYVLGSTNKITDFKNFYIKSGTILTFSGKSSSATVSANEIEYVKFDA